MAEKTKKKSPAKGAKLKYNSKKRSNSPQKGVKYIRNIKGEEPIKAICIPNTLEKSIEGKYFLGQTGILTLGKGLNAWGGLFNPVGSGINFYNTAITITNLSDTPLTAQIWINTTPPGTAIISDQVSAGNTTFRRPAQPQIQLKYVQSVNGMPAEGVNVFDRLVPPKTTLVRQDVGTMIFGFGGNLVVYLLSPGPELVQAKLAFGWWEQSC